jgi:2,3-diketo-5-methylthio-1-phosphopentane phosphatase
MLRADAPQIRSFILSLGVDPGFSRFVDLARKQARDIIVVSDGYDLYIDPLLEKAGVPGVRYFSNHMEWVDGRPQAIFPHFRPDCERRMANCKCQYLRLGEPNLRRIYIGDGVSDICAAEKADVVYAKADLRRHFERTARPFRPFTTFDDIISAEFHSA